MPETIRLGREYGLTIVKVTKTSLGNYAFYCDHCQAHHTHGRKTGPVTSHCETKNEEFQNGYVLRE